MSNEISKERYELFKEGTYKYPSDMTKTKHFNKYEAQGLDKIDDKHIGAYSTFTGSPASQGILQFDMWNVEPSDNYDWNKLRESLKNMELEILLLAPMPQQAHHKY